MINMEKVNKKIFAINNKDVDDIVKKKVYIPSIGVPENAKQVQDWLNKRLEYLNNVKVYSEVEKDVFMTSLYNDLNTEEKVLADKINNKEREQYEDEEAWEKLVLFRIHRHINDD